MKSSLLFLLLAVREIAVTTGDSISAQCRDRFLEPFSSDSIWNTAIGSAASFAAANLYADAATNPLENWFMKTAHILNGRSSLESQQMRIAAA